ncbi:hypothetical protein [Microcella sp.]|uniref:hypothetical protein n=1 Tax=Microcella sp. TaxID=1913979 RepID=UPI00299F55B8|nr:hypothetical protein [Microcella sp.]MDX2025033.1 hypothetical protein [Microcella sp.]
MSELGDERDPETGAFDADEWFRAQFGGEQAPPVPPAQPAPYTPPPLVSPPAATPPLLPPAAPSELPPWAQPPTMPPGYEPAPTQLSPIIEPEPTQPAEVIASPAVAGAPTEVFAQPDDGGALDALFGSESFQEYDDALIPVVPRSSRRGGDGEGPEGEKAPLGRTQKVLLWVAGSLVAVLALVAIFFVGTRIPLLLGPAPGAEPLPTASPSPSATEIARPVGPVPPGEYRWDEIWGGECIEPFVDAWQEDVTVVDCATAHGGQLVLRAPFPEPAPTGEAATDSATEGTTAGLTDDVPYPGEEALAAQMSLLCSAAGVINLTAAASVTDLQVQGAYPVSEEQWDAGERDYFCFVSRSSGEPITGSLANPAPAV